MSFPKYIPVFIAPLGLIVCPNGTPVSPKKKEIPVQRRSTPTLTNSSRNAVDDAKAETSRPWAGAESVESGWTSRFPREERRRVICSKRMGEWRL
ncbi:hypothetical protein CDAR_396921 [Caerostris darwini]|uniref:Secreted protein n=1 Tax=Caerostris darwini TaxID=1538125 RepID=A0AAV4Q8J6_9ARAC|nr:hypothetical protein CDAR_396921 [Caerostris darwini]